jgi:serine phosphatase RsbU (regulator of sigma subunit)
VTTSHSPGALKGHTAFPAPNSREWNVSLLNSPAGNARYGGDWCDALAVSDDALALTIGDVSGRGESAAETMEIMRAAVLSNIDENAQPSEVLSVANTVAYSRRSGLIVTAIVAILNRRRRTLTFANAGHPAPLIMTPSLHGFLAQDVGDLPLGIFPKHRAADYVVALPTDALIVLYTDGVTEHERDILRGERALVEACRAAYDGHVPDLATAIAEHVFQECRGHDDAAVTALRELPKLRSAPNTKRVARVEQTFSH